MEIEEAIRELYAAIDSDSMTEEPSNEAMALAITALRAQRERQEGCESADSEEMCEHCSRAIRNDLYSRKPEED